MTRPRPGTVWWKYEDGPADGTGDDVGPAWIVHHDGSDEDVNSGDWVTRSEAVRVATALGYEFCQDGGWEVDGAALDAVDPSPTVEAQAINDRLQSLGVTAEQLHVEDTGTHLRLIGSFVNDKIVARPPPAPDAEFEYRTHSMSMPIEQALEAIDRAVPGWR